MTYCSAPWTTVNIKTDGSFSYCCMSYELLGKSLNDETLVDGRKKILNNEILDVCQKGCYDIETMYQSQRQFTNKIFPIKNEPLPVISPTDIQYVDLRMGNICNYMCLMCNDSQSHLWGKFNNKSNPYINWGDKRKDILEFINQCTNLKRISLSGGEPFYNKQEIFEIMDSLSTDVILKIITNVSVCDDEIIERLNKFPRGVLNCSIDGVEHWIETQRYKSKWSEIEKNILKFSKELHSGWKINLVPTFTLINASGIPSFLKWYFENLEPLRDIHFSYTVLYQPSYLSLYLMPRSTRNKIVDRVLEMNLPLTDEMKNLLSSLNKETTVDRSRILELKNFLSTMEKRINLDITKLIPEIEDIINE